MHELTGNFSGTEAWQEESKQKDWTIPTDGTWGQQ